MTFNNNVQLFAWGGGQSRIIDINPYNISNVDLEKTKSFYREDVKYL